MHLLNDVIHRSQVLEFGSDLLRSTGDLALAAVVVIAY